jgi:hypothetical protein
MVMKLFKIHTYSHSKLTYRKKAFKMQYDVDNFNSGIAKFFCDKNNK